MEKVNWKVDGMTCSNCALTIGKYLEHKGLQNVKVNPLAGDVSFDMDPVTSKQQLIRGIESLGYSVQAGDHEPGHSHEAVNKKFLKNHLQRFLFCLIFTLPLLLHMFVHIPWLMNPWVQLGLTLPVYIVGVDFFGRSAIKSIRNGMPNMNVLVALGATAAFVYSLTGAILRLGPDYMFFETTATIITLVYLGNYLEDASIHSTQKALNTLARSQKVIASMIAFDEHHQEVILPVENSALKHGDLVLIKTGEQVPSDCKVLWGEATVDESIITGESLPVYKKAKDTLIGGSLILDGTVKAQVIAEAKDSVLANIIDLVKRAQSERPPMQLLADRISAVFVPVVLGIAAITLVVNWIVLHQFTPALMRSVAVLVIACPCAMGLATPAAIAVGLGRAARKGILFRNAKSLELFRNIRQVVFDKTGTLTTGNFVIDQFRVLADISSEEFRRIAYSLEKYSNHPIAAGIVKEWKVKDEIRWSKVEEVKGTGMKGVTKEGDVYWSGSFRITASQTRDNAHNVYIMKNDRLLGWIDMKDEIRPEAISVVQYLRHRNIRTILLSGDSRAKCVQLGGFLGIDEVIAEKTPEEKLMVVEDLTLQGPTAMVGDGINDAPALAKATIGISMSEASQLAMQTADVVLMNRGLKHLPVALGLGRHTYITIKQNLFWAFFYNIIALPVASFGLLTPSFAALAMGFSDLILGVNSVRLYVKKVV